MAAADGLTFTPWPHASMPGFSLPALEAAKCVAKQGDEMFERVHLALFRAYFTESRNIGDVDEVARIVEQAAPDVDMARFVADRDAGIGRHAVASDDEAALYARLPERSVPTDLGATRDVYAPTAVLRATHFLPAEAKPSAEHARLGNPPALAISSAYAYDFDPLDGIDASARDFEAVVLHELGHVLGFTSIVGGHETNAGFPVAVSMLDLFRFRPGVRADECAALLTEFFAGLRHS